MEPTPPKGSRNKRFAQNRPFYESSKKTSAEIISEARSTVRPLQTRRPETPLDLNNRTLFGKQREGRPPSAVSISSSFHDSRPPSGKGKLTPLANVPDFKELELRLEEKFTIDKNSNEIGNDNNNNNNSAKKQMKIKGNIIPKSAEPSFSRARRSIKSSKVVEERRVHSGPKERPPIFRDDDLKRSNSYSDLTSTDEKVTETKHSSNEQIDSDSFYNTNIEPLINQMHLNYEYGDIESLLVNLDFLWRVLEVSNMVGQNAKIAREHRAAILTKLSSYVNNKNALLQLRICKLYLGLKVTKRNLSAVCKSFYQVTKNEKNDDMVLQEKMIEPILTILNNPEQVDSTTDLVYLVGALKILSNQPKCSKEIRLLDLLTPLKCLLQFSVKKYTSAVQIKESNHMLIQASSLLNNLADSATLANQFIENNILQLLMDLMKARLDDVDLIMPIASIFSKLTISESICNNVVEVESNPGLLMNTLIKHTNTQEIVVRFGYAFGNMANHSPKFRDIILSSNDMTKNFVKVIRFYTKKLRKDRSQTDLTESSKECEEDEDVLVKLIRVIANLSITKEGAVLFSNNEELIQVILALLENCDLLKLSQELIINTSATVNNMSFFNDLDSILVKNTETFTRAFLDIVLTKNQDCCVEAMRALGNFTQSEDSRRLLVEGRGLQAIIMLLDSSSIDLAFCVCGVLINMMVDRSTRTLIKNDQQTISKFVDLLKNAVDVDWALVGLVCQILWNYTEDMNSTHEYFDDIDAEDLITTLTDFTDPSIIATMLHPQSSTNETETREEVDEEYEEHFKESWGEFLPIGQSLLQRMEQCHSHLEPLVTPPD